MQNYIAFLNILLMFGLYFPTDAMLQWPAPAPVMQKQRPIIKDLGTLTTTINNATDTQYLIYSTKNRRTYTLNPKTIVTIEEKINTFRQAMEEDSPLLYGQHLYAEIPKQVEKYHAWGKSDLLDLYYTITITDKNEAKYTMSLAADVLRMPKEPKLPRLAVAPYSEQGSANLVNGPLDIRSEITLAGDNLEFSTMKLLKGFPSLAQLSSSQIADLIFQKKHTIEQVPAHLRDRVNAHLRKLEKK